MNLAGLARVVRVVTSGFCLLAAVLVAAIYPWLAPLAIGEIAEFAGHPALALSEMRSAPEWAAPDGRLAHLERDAADRRHELTVRLTGAHVTFDTRCYDAASARKTGLTAQAARLRVSARLGAELPPVPVRLPLWRNPDLLGAYDHLAVNFSPLGARSARVILHETAHFAWYERLLAMPGLPVSNPLWLEEGLAEMLAIVETGGEVPAASAESLEALDRLVAFEHDYSAAASWVGFLVSTRGWDKARTLLRTLRSGSPTWEALGRAYGEWPEDLLDEWRSTPAPLASPVPVTASSAPAVVHRAVASAPPVPLRSGADLSDFLLSAALIFVGLRLLALAWRLRSWLFFKPVLLPVLFLANRAAWGAGLEVLTVEGWLPFLPYIWRHRLLWVFDTLILLAAARQLRLQFPSALWASAAALATGMAILSGQASICAPRAPDAGLLLVMLLLPLRCSVEAAVFATTGRARYLLAGLYALFVHGAGASWTALGARMGLALLAGQSRTPGAVLAGWELAGPILLWREAMAPAKLGCVTLAAGGAAGLDGWLPVAIALLTASLLAERWAKPDRVLYCAPCAES